MSQGVFLVEHGKRGYAYMTYHLAMSIKKFNPDIHITVFTDGNIHRQVDMVRKSNIDQFIEIPSELFEYNFKGTVNAGKIKVAAYDFIPYDECLYLDVDALAMGDIQPIFDELKKDGGYFYTHTFGTHTLSQGNDMAVSQWAWANDIWSHYGLKADAIFPGTNTSFQYIRKCKESKELIRKIQQNFKNPLPLEKLRKQWGGGQPDELAVSVACTEMGIVPKPPKDYIFFGQSIDPRPVSQIEKEYLILSIFGGKLFTNPAYTELYDERLIRYHREKGLDHIYKYGAFISGDKHASNRPIGLENDGSLSSEPVPVPVRQMVDVRMSNHRHNLIEALIPISSTKLIDSKKLIQTYRSPENRPIAITNWLNGSIIEYKGKTIFCYRMEARPFCTIMKLGICYLDSDMQPIEKSNVLLELYSELTSPETGHKFACGFHVEDPRLFIYNDELYLSYTDGYQMGQAKINPDTLQAEKSFYIEKPDDNRTEKNWTFFEHDKKLFSVYDINTHTIFEMHGHEWEQKYQSSFESFWNYGELRGGTSPIFHNGEYIAFFHSAKGELKKGVMHRQYFMGAYTFEAKPPFRITSMTTKPIIAGEYIEPSAPRLSNKIFVVFPAGVIRKDDNFLVSFGYNDYENRIVEVTDEFLKGQLRRIKQEELV